MVRDERDNIRLVVDDENALGGAGFCHGWKLAAPLSWRQLAICHECVTTHLRAIRPTSGRCTPSAERLRLALLFT